MKGLKRNKQSFYYALATAETEATNSLGEYTGGHNITYDTPVKAFGNISAAKGNYFLEPFGISENIKLDITTCDLNLPITETSILWIGITPSAQGEGGTVKHNYVVENIARTLNSITYTVKKVVVK